MTEKIHPCFEKVNKSLKLENTELVIDKGTKSVVINTKKVLLPSLEEVLTAPQKVVASHCPFCGKRLL